MVEVTIQELSDSIGFHDMIEQNTDEDVVQHSLSLLADETYGGRDSIASNNADQTIAQTIISSSENEISEYPTK